MEGSELERSRSLVVSWPRPVHTLVYEDTAEAAKLLRRPETFAADGADKRFGSTTRGENWVECSSGGQKPPRCGWHGCCWDTF